ncbi:MAG TPA: DUF58 domain-containing protein [Pseudomonadota bacterium]|jgi:uncharacterized protein (DUF58 family)|nr:DUF58 domain-containing protein [Pseudomonadota bacterium]
MNSRLLDLPSLLRLKSLLLQARVVADGALQGVHRALRQGASVEFAEHKEYAPGDDLRHIDWRAFGRRDKYYVKRFEEETEVRAYVIVDASGSMGYGRKDQLTKLHFAKLLSAALSYLLLRQHDPTGLVLAKDTGPTYIPPRSGAEHLGFLCQALEEVQAVGRTELSEALSFLSETARRRSMVVVVSDLLPAPPLDEQVDYSRYLAKETGTLVARLCGLRAQKHDVMVLQTLDADELELPWTNLTWFEEVEPGLPAQERLFVDPADVRKAYKAELANFLNEVRRGLREGDVEYHMVPTSRSPESVLLDLLRGPLRQKVRR